MTRCSPPIIHINGRHELCLKPPIYLQATKSGICERCRRENYQASMAKGGKVRAVDQHGNKTTRPAMVVDSKKEGGRRNRYIKRGEVEMRRRNREGVLGESPGGTKLPNGMKDLLCQYVSENYPFTGETLA